MSRNRLQFGRLALAATLLVASCAGWAQTLPPRQALHNAATRNWTDADESLGLEAFSADSQPASFVPGNGVDYHGGPVMTPANGDATVNVYFIWYGNWSNGPHASDAPQTKDLLSALFSSTGLNDSGYEKIVSTYGDANSNATGNVLLVKSASDGYSRGTRLRDADVSRIVGGAVASGTLPSDPHGIYFVLTSSDVAETSGFCVKYCGWHSSAMIGGADLKYAFVGNPDRCPSLCEAQTVSPNGNSGADAMASVRAHEANETITDPDGNAWYDVRGFEIADKCAWKFGPTQTTSSGAKYNLTLANYNWLIQLNWSNSIDPVTGQRGGCAQSLGGRFFNY